MHAELTLDGPIALASLEQLADCPIQAQLSDAARKRLHTGCTWVDGAVRSGKPCYGINTGFGHLKNARIAEADLERLQENLILSHAVGTGDAAAAQTVRWMILFKIQSLIAGHSGIRPATVDGLLALLNADCLPVVPSRGSLGASGDLAPLAHLVLPLIGRGEVTLAGQRMPADGALQKLGLEPIRLQAKEGLALINGTQYMAAIAAEVVVRARRLVRMADIIASMTLDAWRGSLAPYDRRLHALRPHPGAQAVARNMHTLLDDSQIMASHAHCDKVQDPYSLRCCAQVHGAARDALAHAAAVVEIEINSVTDNPLLFDGGDVISGGNFHGESLALVLDYMAIAVSELASISERRTYLLMSTPDELPIMLIPDAGLNTGLMIVQYTSAALVNENKVLSTPASVDTIPTSMGQEDHVSMGATSANKILAVLRNTETVLAAEALCAAQGLDFRAPLQAGAGPRAAHSALRKVIPHVDVDRLFGEDLETARQMVRTGALLEAVEDVIGRLE